MKYAKKLGMILLSGVLTCTSPSAVFAEDITQKIQDMVTEDTIEFFLEDPDRIVDIISYVKDFIDQQNITDEDILNIIDQAADHFELSLTDSDKKVIMELFKEFKDLDEEELKEYIEKICDTMDFIGVDAKDVKNIFDKTVDFFSDLLK